MARLLRCEGREGNILLPLMEDETGTRERVRRNGRVVTGGRMTRMTSLITSIGLALAATSAIAQQSRNPGGDADERDCLTLPTPAEVIKRAERK
jgi:hypothetical protein